MPLYVVHQCPTVEEWMEYDANVVKGSFRLHSYYAATCDLR